MALLQKVERGRTPKPPRVMVYGAEGVGKSTFAAQASRTIFIQTEEGLDEIPCDRFPLARTLDEVLDALRELKAERHEYETVVIDSLDWLERLIWDRICQESGVATIEKADGGYARGYIHALNYWRELVGLLDTLRNDRGMVVLLIAHAKIEKFEDPESSAYDRYSPRLHKHATALLCEWCDAVLFAMHKIRTQTEDAGFNRKRTIAHALGRDGGERILRCVGTPTCLAKNRYGLHEDLPLDWAAFVGAISQQHSRKE